MFKTARDRAGLSQAAVATALGLEQAAISKWETGRALPETARLVRFAGLVRCPVEDLVVGIDHAYDRWRRDLLRQEAEVHEAPTVRGAHAQAFENRIRELERQLQDREAELREAKDAAMRYLKAGTELAKRVIAREDDAASSGAPRRRRRR